MTPTHWAGATQANHKTKSHHITNPFQRIAHQDLSLSRRYNAYMRSDLHAHAQGYDLKWPTDQLPPSLLYDRHVPIGIFE